MEEATTKAREDDTKMSLQEYEYYCDNCRVL